MVHVCLMFTMWILTVIYIKLLISILVDQVAEWAFVSLILANFSEYDISMANTAAKCGFIVQNSAVA